MKRIHIALSTPNVAASVAEYTKRMGCSPVVVVADQYALWRTETVNLSVRQSDTVSGGQLRHLGWEEPGVPEFTQSMDVNGIPWESFTAEQQAEEIHQLWPETEYSVS